jgi:hypothetical protein
LPCLRLSLDDRVHVPRALHARDPYCSATAQERALSNELGSQAGPVLLGLRPATAGAGEVGGRAKLQQDPRELLRGSFSQCVLGIRWITDERARSFGPGKSGVNE